MIYDAGNTNKKNRQLSGCQTDDGAVSKSNIAKQPDSCDGDPLQFHLTKKPKPAGKLSFPYDKDGKDNHYSIGRNQPDLLQCRVTVNFHGPEFHAEVYDVTGAQKGYCVRSA